MANTWISFEEIKKAVSLQMVLNHYRIELRTVGAGTLRGKCPLPMHGSDHKNGASFTATLTKGVGGVWACQSTTCIKVRDGKRGGNALDFVATMDQCTIRDAAAKLAEWFDVPKAEPGATAPDRNPDQEKPAQLVSKKEKEASAESAFNKPLTFTLQGINHAHPYLKERGVPDATARALGVGVFGGRGSMQGRCVIPIHNGEGELVGYAGRSIDGSEPKYRFPTGFHKGLELYNLHRAIGGSNSRHRVVVVEGFFDCFRVSAAGFPCVALMGAAMSEAQEELLVRHFNVVCIMLDGDQAGRDGAADCVVRLGRRMWTYAPALPEGKQPDMLAPEEIQALLKK